jgi:hypothetical protein
MGGLESGGGNGGNHQGPGGWGMRKARREVLPSSLTGATLNCLNWKEMGPHFGRRALRILACASNSRGDLAEHQNTS